MIKPDSLWALFKQATPDDILTIGKICYALGGHSDVDLDSTQRLLMRSIQSDCEKFNNNIIEKREKERDRKHKQRHSDNNSCRSDSKTSGNVSDMSRGVPRSPAVSRGVPRCPAPSRGVPRCLVSINQTTNHPTTRPTNLKNRSDADTRVREESPYGRGGSASASESEQIAKAVSELPTKGRRTDIWRWSNDDIRGRREDCPVDTAAMLSCAFGKGSWRKVVAQAGDDPVRELFITFRNEISLGEHVDNPAAAFSERCEHDLGVDFTLTMDESIKRGKSPDGTLKESVS